MINYVEANMGHPEKWDCCLGHLAEAAEAVFFVNEAFGLFLREEYLRVDKALGQRPEYSGLKIQIDYDNLFEQLGLLKENE